VQKWQITERSQAMNEVVIELLQSRFQAAPDISTKFEFKIHLAKDLSQLMAAGVSLVHYRIYPNGTLRRPRGRPGPERQQYRNQLPLDLHFTLTAWAQDPSPQHLIAGWMMRMIEVTPILPLGLLDQRFTGHFSAEEAVVITSAELSIEEQLRMREVIITNVYQLSVPYAARYDKVESELLLEIGRPIQETPRCLERCRNAGGRRSVAFNRAGLHCRAAGDPVLGYRLQRANKRRLDGYGLSQGARRPATTSFCRERIRIEVNAG
jgi:hypothetical protein